MRVRERIDVAAEAAPRGLLEQRERELAELQLLRCYGRDARAALGRDWEEVVDAGLCVVK